MARLRKRSAREPGDTGRLRSVQGWVPTWVNRVRPWTCVRGTAHVFGRLWRGMVVLRLHRRDEPFQWEWACCRGRDNTISGGRTPWDDPESGNIISLALTPNPAPAC
jgi:uncharacterized Fe-S cluster protein YjdI